jgi:hypothetical protein
MTDELLNYVRHRIAALVACGMATESEVKDKTDTELFDLATRKTIQIAMAGSKIQAAYRAAYRAIETEYDCENKKEDGYEQKGRKYGNGASKAN